MATSNGNTDGSKGKKTNSGPRSPKEPLTVPVAKAGPRNPKEPLMRTADTGNKMPEPPPLKFHTVSSGPRSPKEPL
jgi:hypothetical protein